MQDYWSWSHQSSDWSTYKPLPKLIQYPLKPEAKERLKTCIDSEWPDCFKED